MIFFITVITVSQPTLRTLIILTRCGLKDKMPGVVVVFSVVVSGQIS